MKRGSYAEFLEKCKINIDFPKNVFFDKCFNDFPERLNFVENTVFYVFPEDIQSCAEFTHEKGFKYCTIFVMDSEFDDNGYYGYSSRKESKTAMIKDDVKIENYHYVYTRNHIYLSPLEDSSIYIKENVIHEIMGTSCDSIILKNVVVYATDFTKFEEVILDQCPIPAENIRCSKDFEMRNCYLHNDCRFILSKMFVLYNTERRKQKAIIEGDGTTEYSKITNQSVILNKEIKTSVPMLFENCDFEINCKGLVKLAF
jgi:hypothetical protein